MANLQDFAGKAKNAFKSNVSQAALAAALVATPIFATAATPEEARAASADCNQSIVYYDAKTVRKRAIVGITRNYPNIAPMEADPGTITGSRVFTCGGEMHKKFTDSFGTDAKSEAYSTQHHVEAIRADGNPNDISITWLDKNLDRHNLREVIKQDQGMEIRTRPEGKLTPD